MNDHRYNEDLKYPLFRVHPTNPKIIRESKQLLGYHALEDRIQNAIKDALNTTDDFQWVSEKEKHGIIYTRVLVTEQDLSLPFQQFEEIYLAPVLKILNRKLFNKLVRGLRVKFDYVPSGLYIYIDSYE